MASLNVPTTTEFSAPYAPEDDALAAALVREAGLPEAAERAVDRTARRLIEAIRTTRHPFGSIDELLQEFSLSTREGLALMVLAEALLRVPDQATTDEFIEDKLREGDFVHHVTKSQALFVNASAWALGVTSQVVQGGETPQEVVAALTKRVGMPIVRAAMRRAMRVMGDHFVLGETIDAALARSREHTSTTQRYSFDMLGEGARTAADAARYFDAYAAAIDAIGASAGGERLPARPGISVKLSALYPRYEATCRERVLKELAPRLLDLARRAKGFDLNLTVDAEEADRLELSLDVIAAVLADSSLSGWDGFGLAVQAYQKRAAAVIDYVDELARARRRRLMVRLVKGAYWDTEVKRAQERGLDGYPVFTLKAMTDLNYLACARKLVALKPRLFAQFATHNALTVASVLEVAGAAWGDFEFQRLHGMGDALYARLAEDFPQAAVRTYAPVGSHRDLLAYLVRRLLENGANSSFVAAVGDATRPVEELLMRPAAIVRGLPHARPDWLPLPADLYAPARKNSRGVEFGHRASLDALLAEVARESRSPVVPAPANDADAAMAAAARGFAAWNATPAETRAAALDRAADLIEARRGRLIALMQSEAGKTLDDCVSEVREAADLCRYYAAEGRALFGPPQALPGPTGETNSLVMRGRGAWVAIAPWNFPLAIFTGQIAAALMAGNSVVAKPAEQTPLIGAEAVRILHEAGVPATALHLVTGDGRTGARLVAHDAVAGVVFTGSTEVARSINRALAAKEGPIVPLIAETGGINAMIVDATALPEQVTDDVVASAFRSAGQRCSSLRLLCLQDEIADTTIAMIAGAAREMKVGDPREIDTAIGPLIDADSFERITAHIARAKRVRFAGTAEMRGGFYLPPHIIELASPDELTEEIFGPVLHVVRYKAAELPQLLDAIDRKGFGLTLGVHSRISSHIERIVARMPTGNIYVNRNMIGAVVGTQPFGGGGLSGTGPKAGGPNYLRRFATEQVVTINTAAAGGNASLLARER
ncbi:MAG TPA: L-glutamate gamma-semialdehyde dehydrogenase [Pseudolabrys sp.]|nr:L-glutamate gamma-semialdehyde dehydrogenase [Pseudolabrys sp.]